MRHLNIPSHIKLLLEDSTATRRIQLIKTRYKAIKKTKDYDVSVVIPAYNEEKNILITLQSLVLNETTKSVEIIVVNNNSSDDTETVVRATGVTCINEKKQGITAARNAGLAIAKGKYILNADADSLYPPGWIDAMVNPLEKDINKSLTYGRFSFIPVGKTNRYIYFFYEYLTDFNRLINKKYKEEAVNVYGFNSCYRRLHGLQVDGYNHPAGSNEDGWLALKLRNTGFGKLHLVTDRKAMVWTTDRRLQTDGGFIKAVAKRVKLVFIAPKVTVVRADL